MTLCKKLRTPLTALSVPIGIIVGVIVVASANPPFSKRTIMVVGFPGELNLLAVRCISLPLIVISTVTGVSSLSAILTKSLSFKYMLYIIGTKFICVILGMLLAIALVPTNFATDPKLRKNQVDGIVISDAYEDWFRLLFPKNVIEMFFRSEETYYSISNWGVVLQRIVLGTNYVGLILISITSGIVLRVLANKAEDMLQVLHGLVKVFAEILSWIAGLLPILMIFDVASSIMTINLSQVDQNFYILYLTVMCSGLSILLILVYPLIYLAIVRKNPFTLMKNFGEAMVTGFAGSSTIVAMKKTIGCMENKNNVDKRFTRALIPIGNAIHLSGKTFQGVVVAIFTANSSKIYLSEVDYFTILLLGFLASFAVGPLPMKHRLCSMILLNGIGMQNADVSAILMLEWIVCRCTAIVDIAGDCVGVAVMAHLHRDFDNDVPTN